MITYATGSVSAHSLYSDFSIAQRRISAQSGHQSEQAEADQVQLILDKSFLNEKSGDEAVEKAQQLYVRWYGYNRIVQIRSVNDHEI